MTSIQGNFNTLNFLYGVSFFYLRGIYKSGLGKLGYYI